MPLHGIEAADAVFANTYRGGYLAKTSGHKQHWESAVRLVRERRCFGRSADGMQRHSKTSATGSSSTRKAPSRSTAMQPPEQTPEGSICIGCGFCCDGTLHGRTTVRPNDEAGVRAVDLAVEQEGGKRFFRQPCPRFSCSSCSIYANRPGVCRTYQCALLTNVKAGIVSEADAREKIETAKQLRNDVRSIDPAAVTPKERTALARKLREELVGLDRDKRQGVGKALLATALLEQFLDRWFVMKVEGGNDTAG